MNKTITNSPKARPSMAADGQSVTLDSNVPEPRVPLPASAVYAQFLADLERSLSRRQGSARTLRSTEGVHRQLLRLLSSFGDFSPVQQFDATRVEEWNPFSQRPVIQEEDLAPDALDQDFESQANGVRRYLSTTHEITHCLLWEPFFVGALLPNRRQFIDLSLAFEGFCFWHTDVVLTRRTRALTPDNELVHERCCVSQIHFHPYRAFEAVGVTDELDILEFYMAAFTGHRTPLLDSDSPFARNLARRTISLYVTHSRSLPAAYRELNRAGTFRDFYRRFCARPGLPALLRAPFDPGTQTFDYLRWVATKGMASLSRASDSLLACVRTRRRIQTRAYHALQLRSMWRDGRLAGEPATAAAQSGLESCIARYIDRLELALQSLIDSGSSTSAEALLGDADAYYENEVRRRVERPQLWVSSRTLIFGPTVGSIGAGRPVKIDVAGGFARASVKELRQLAQQAIGVYLNQVVERVVVDKDAGPLAEVMTLGARLLGCLNALDAGLSSARDELAATLTQFLRLELIRPQWSVPVGTVSPAQGRFRELAFIFE